MAQMLEGSLAVVTGAGRGIGRATAVALGRRGVSVLAVSRTQAELEETERLFRAQAVAGARIASFAVDLSKAEAAREIFSAAEGKLGGTPTILVNNAAIAPTAPIEAVSAEMVDAVFAVNVRAPLLLSQALFQACRRARSPGAIVNLSSLGGLRGTAKFPGFAPYAASKAAIVSMTECLAVEGRALGIRVNCIAPGAVETRMLREAAPHLKTETRPEDIATLIVGLCDPVASRALTGSTIDVHSNA